MQQSHKKVKDTAKESADGAKKSWEESNQSTVASTESATSKMAGLMKKSAAVIGVASVATAKKTIDVGKSFEAGMSEVQAISGASEKIWKSYLQKQSRWELQQSFLLLENLPQHLNTWLWPDGKQIRWFLDCLVL